MLPKVVALVGGMHSVVSARVASLGASLELPQIAWGSTSPTLSDKLQYPFFLRTIPPDTIQVPRESGPPKKVRKKGSFGKGVFSEKSIF